MGTYAETMNLKPLYHYPTPTEALKKYQKWNALGLTQTKPKFDLDQLDLFHRAMACNNGQGLLTSLDGFAKTTRSF